MSKQGRYSSVLTIKFYLALLFPALVLLHMTTLLNLVSNLNPYYVAEVECFITFYLLPQKNVILVFREVNNLGFRPVRWLVYGLVWAGWCWFVVREKHCWLAGLGWLKPTNEQAV